jgi:protein-disulfide isomerase
MKNSLLLILIVLLASCAPNDGPWFAGPETLESESTLQISCIDYPEYCVPFAGTEQNESPDLRELDMESQGAAGVVRGITADHRPFIGNPDAPVHIWIVASFTCSHCWDYHYNVFQPLVKDFVLTGQATIEYSSYSGVGGYPATNAMLGALCAGEQGAFWEFADQLYLLAPTADEFATESLSDTADQFGLDAKALENCLGSNQYDAWSDEYDRAAMDYGVTGTPDVFVRYNTGDWTPIVNPSYGELSRLIQAAQP